MDEQELQKIISEVQTGNDQKRRAASYKLGKIKDSKAVQALIKSYNDSDSTVRQNSIDSLRNIGSKEAQEFLITQGKSIGVSENKSSISPKAKGIIAGCIVMGIAIVIMTIFTMMAPAIKPSIPSMDSKSLQTFSSIASILQVIEYGSCPTAIIIGIIVYSMAKKPEEN